MLLFDEVDGVVAVGCSIEGDKWKKGLGRQSPRSSSERSLRRPLPALLTSSRYDAHCDDDELS